MDFTIVTAVTPDYLPRLVWALPTWVHKPQFKDRHIVVFHSGFNEDSPKELEFIKTVFPTWTFVFWRMGKYEGQRELMLSAFILGIKEYVKTPYSVKLDGDCYFTNKEDVFTEEDLAYDLVGHKWGYTKPGWWIDKLEGRSLNNDKVIESHDRIASFCCLQKTEFVNKVAEQCGSRLPVPSHDTVMWWYASKQGKWKGKNMKSLGVDNNTNWKKIREAVCSNKSNECFKLNKVQLEITTDCNLKCFNCDRQCGIAPSKEYMTLEQIWKFVEESLTRKWDRIDIIGGEPTMYPDLFTLWQFIKMYKNTYPDCVVRFSTNGLNKYEVPDFVKVRDSSKKGREQGHIASNSAPIDNNETEIKACSVPFRCGIALTRYGYFLCGAGASIARVFGLDIGIKNLRDVTDEALLKQQEVLCKYCGNANVPSKHVAKGQEISPSWEKAIKSYKENKMGLY